MPDEFYCDKCILHETSVGEKNFEKYKLNCLRGSGPADAKIFIIGMNPANEECVEQRNFVDKEGEKLNECLVKAGLTREEVFVEYLVKCRTPKVEKSGVLKNRDPSVKEVRICKDYLDESLKRVKPNIIILLGNVVSQAIIGKKGVTSIHGTPYWNEEYQATCIPCLSPLALSKSFSKPKDEADFIEDLKYAKESSYTKEFKEKSKLKTNYIYCNTLDKAKAVIKRLTEVLEYVTDIETTGLLPKTSKLLGIGFSWKEGTGVYIPMNTWFKYYTEVNLDVTEGIDLRNRREEVIIEEIEIVKKKEKKVQVRSGTMIYVLEEFWTPKEYAELMPLLIPAIVEPKVRKIGHNLGFDIGYLNEIWDIDILNANYCTQLADYLPDPERIGGRALVDLAWLHTDMGGYDDGLKDERQHGFMHTEPEELAYYGCGDCDSTLRIKHKQIQAIAPYLELLENIVTPLSIAIVEMRNNGVRIDLERIKKLTKEYEDKIEKCEAKLYNLSDVKKYTEISDEKQYKVIKKKYLTSKIIKKKFPKCDDYILPKIKPFNFGSPKQLGELLNYLNLDTGSKTKAGLPVTNEKALLGLKGKHKLMDNLLELRHVKKIHSTYLKPIPEKVSEEGKLHTNYRVDRTATGRLASSKPNLHNIPKKKEGNEIRDYFISSEDHLMAELDLKQIEYRILAHFVNDNQMIQDIFDGQDIHREIYSDIHNIPQDQVTSKQRDKSKSVTYGVPYGRSSYSLALEYGMPESEAEELRKALLNKYPIEPWIDAMIARANEVGYVKTFFGRIRFLPKMHDNDYKIAQAEERKVVATCIQGTASDILSIYTINIRNKLREMKSKTKMILTVHDALFFDIPKDEVKAVIKMLKEEMQRPISWQGKDIRVPIETDTKIGTRWGSLVDYEEGALV